MIFAECLQIQYVTVSKNLRFMKLHEYLKQFEGLDPNLEVYQNDPPAEGWESEHDYPQATNEGYVWWRFVYADSLNKNVSYNWDNGPDIRFNQLIILV